MMGVSWSSGMPTIRIRRGLQARFFGRANPWVRSLFFGGIHGKGATLIVPTYISRAPAMSDPPRRAELPRATNQRHHRSPAAPERNGSALWP
jgi:hypothetical protein